MLTREHSHTVTGAERSRTGQAGHPVSSWGLLGPAPPPSLGGGRTASPSVVRGAPAPSTRMFSQPLCLAFNKRLSVPVSPQRGLPARAQVWKPGLCRPGGAPRGSPSGPRGQLLISLTPFPIREKPLEEISNMGQA